MLLSFSLPLFKVRKKEEWNGFYSCPQSRFAPLIHPLILGICLVPCDKYPFCWSLFVGLDVLMVWIQLWSRLVISSCQSDHFHLPRDSFASDISVLVKGRFFCFEEQQGLKNSIGWGDSSGLISLRSFLINNNAIVFKHSRFIHPLLTLFHREQTQ